MAESHYITTYKGRECSCQGAILCPDFMAIYGSDERKWKRKSVVDCEMGDHFAYYENVSDLTKPSLFGNYYKHAWNLL